MTNQQIKLIEDSWDFVILNTEEAGLIFYNKLFELDPGFRSLFKEDIKVQADKLVSMISFIVSKINSLEDVIKDVKQLGKRHSRYNVKDEYYNTVAIALLSTL